MPNPFDQSFLAPWGASTAKEYATAVGGAMAQAPASFAGTLGGMYGAYNQGYGSYNQALSGLGNSYAQNYGALAGGIGNIANALGNTWNNAQATNQAASSAEAARQMAVGQMGSAALGSYGQLGVANMDAWARNQNGYQKSLSDQVAANQAAVSGLGQARYGALANLGTSTAKYGIGQEVAGVIPGLLQDGEWKGGGAGGSGGQGWGALDSLRQDINSPREADQLQGGYMTGLDALNANQAQASDYTRQQMRDNFSDIMAINRLNLGASGQGMNQFYDYMEKNPGSQARPGQPIPTGSLLDALAAGYSDSAGRIGGVQGDLNSGWSDASSTYSSATGGVRDLFDSSVGKFFLSGPEAQQQSFQMQDALAERRKQLAALNGGIIGVPWNYRGIA